MRNISHPLLDAFRYYAQGDYNPGDQKYTQDVINKGIEAWKKSSVQNWWNTEGKGLYIEGAKQRKK